LLKEIELLMKHDHKSVTKPLAYCFVLLYMRIFETIGDLIDLLKETLFNNPNKELIGLSMLKVKKNLKAIKVNIYFWVSL